MNGWPESAPVEMSKKMNEKDKRWRTDKGGVKEEWDV